MIAATDGVGTAPARARRAPCAPRRGPAAGHICAINAPPSSERRTRSTAGSAAGPALAGHDATTGSRSGSAWLPARGRPCGSPSAACSDERRSRPRGSRARAARQGRPPARSAGTPASRPPAVCGSISSAASDRRGWCGPSRVRPAPRYCRHAASWRCRGRSKDSAPSSAGIASGSSTASTSEARSISSRWPSRPNPVTSVQAVAR